MSKTLVATSKPGTTHIVARVDYKCSEARAPRHEGEEADLDATRYFNQVKRRERKTIQSADFLQRIAYV